MVFGFSHALPMSLIFVFVQAGLRHVFCPATALLPASFLTVSKRTFRTRVVANASFLGCSELGFRWCLAFSHALPMRLRFLSSDCAALSFSFNGFEADVSDPCGRAANASFLGLSELGFRWCLAFSHALPRNLIFVFVQAGLRHVFCPATALLCPSLLTVSKEDGSDPCGCERIVFGLL